MTKPNNHSFDEAQLLALIEDQLDTSAAERFKAELADKPELLKQIEQMRADRASVRSLPEPELSRDLLESLEPALARPMLLAPLSAAEYRKRHAHARRPRRFARLAMAAAFLLIVFAGVWAASTGLLTGGDDRVSAVNDIVASRTPGAGVVDQRALHDGSMLASADDTQPFDRVTVHHLPPPTDVREALSEMRLAAAEPADAGMAKRSGATRSDGAAKAKLAEAPFALVIETDDLDRTITLLSETVDPASAPMSLVRNITENEVLEYGKMLARQGAATKRLSAPSVASASTEDRSAPSANSPARAMEPLPAPLPGSLPLGEQLAGDPERAADVSDQLRFSNAGAQYALTVPADRVAEALMAINLASGQTTSLRSLDAIDAAPAEKSKRAVSLELQWIEQLRDIRQSLEKIDFANASNVVIPVRIDVRESRSRK